ncbi:TM2 domain-containing protein [Haloferax mucosum ATCC BAA-1512]|uniref:TM2 domain-containing protein n=1 Tax=Haloferax mucosum ATCC BAA-1512 TaxID=662479 RepID=M0I583_9EURY|nr:zinc ribbon domain-containing protein [Haloferax mucosum]ELZ91926.1 TM2 domain-containing protein [Haloferax mucosum ATCC BAA-1512]
MSTPADEQPSQERGPNEVFCRDCGAVIDERAEICPQCGVRQRNPPTTSLDAAADDLLEGGNPFVAALLSAIFPGMGQLYNRELGRGLVFAVAMVVASFSVVIAVGLVLAPAVWIYAIYDAYTRAELRATELQREVTEHETESDDGDLESDADDIESSEDGVASDEADTVSNEDDTDATADDEQ